MEPQLFPKPRSERPQYNRDGMPLRSQGEHNIRVGLARTGFDLDLLESGFFPKGPDPQQPWLLPPNFDFDALTGPEIRAAMDLHIFTIDYLTKDQITLYKAELKMPVNPTATKAILEKVNAAYDANQSQGQPPTL